MIRVIFIIVYLNLSLGVCSVFGQIYEGSYRKTVETFKGIQDPKNSRVLKQLILEGDSTFILKSISFVPEKKQCVTIIDSTTVEGIWKIKSDTIELEPFPNQGQVLTTYHYRVKSNKLLFLNLGKEYARRTKLRKVKCLKELNTCER